VYRRDTIDRTRTGEPHQIDLWRARSGATLDRADLNELIEIAVDATLPSRAARSGKGFDARASELRDPRQRLRMDRR
jgi:hypothetical protein